jgi:hypothetical protein
VVATLASTTQPKKSQKSQKSQKIKNPSVPFLWSTFTCARNRLPLCLYLSSSLPSRPTSLSLSLEPFEFKPLPWPWTQTLPSLERAPASAASSCRTPLHHATQTQTQHICRDPRLLRIIIITIERTFNKVCTSDPYLFPYPPPAPLSQTIVWTAPWHCSWHGTAAVETYGAYERSITQSIPDVAARAGKMGLERGLYALGLVCGDGDLDCAGWRSFVYIPNSC